MKNYNPILITNGTYRLGPQFHHIKLFEYAASFLEVDFVVVAINSDESIKKLKGDKFFLPQEERKFMIESCKFVDLAIIFDDEKQLENLIKGYRPEILLKGEEYRGKTITGQDYAKRIEYFPMISGASTTNLIQKIQEPLIKSLLESKKEVSMNEKLNEVHGGYIDAAKNLIYPKCPRY